MNIKNISGSALLVLLPLVLIELIFRILPVSYPPYILPVSSEDPIARYQSNLEYTYSKDWNFSITASKYSNNYGFINQNDYEANANSPLLVVIGDSFVEAHQVDSGKSAAELLHSGLEPEGRVYSIGLSGSPLSQYLKYAEYSTDSFQPDAMAFVIIANDFDESLKKYNPASRFHLFVEEGDDLVLDRVDYSLSAVKKILRQSAFVRYIMLNLEASASLTRLLDSWEGAEAEFVGNVPASVEEEKMQDSFRVIDEFFAQLPIRTGLEANKILFIIDGSRPALYTQEGLDNESKSYFGEMKRYFSSKADLLGYEVIDMQPVFVEKHRAENTRFEFETDGHWNEAGHSLVAEAVQQSEVFMSIFRK